MDQSGNHIILRGNQPGTLRGSQPGAAERMRELLAPAVPHLEDDRERPPRWARSLAEHIEILRSQALDALRAQDARLVRLQQDIGELQQSMEAAAGRFSRLDKAVAELTQRAGYMDKELSVIKGRVEAGSEALTAAGSRIGALDTRLERLDERLDDQYDRVSAIDNTLAALDGRLTGLGEQVAAVSGRLDSVDHQLSRMPAEEAVAKIVEAASGDVAGRLGSLDTTVLTLAETLQRPAARAAPLPRKGGRI